MGLNYLWRGAARVAKLNLTRPADLRAKTGLSQFEFAQSIGVGVVAQELVSIVPEVVMTHEDGLLSVAFGNFVGVLIEAVKELSEKVYRLEARA